MVDLLVVGAGPGGYEAAAYAAELGREVILFEKGKLGGTCLNTGCIPTKTLLRSARAYRECRDAGSFGIEVGDPSVNMAQIQARKERVVSTLRKGVTRMLATRKVKVVEAPAELKGPGKVTADGTEYTADNILIATGSQPAVPPVEGIDGPEVLDSTAILELESIPGSVAIIGAGVIGVEFASFFAELGTDVTVIEMLPGIVPGLDREIAKHLSRVLKKLKVSVKTSSRVEAIEDGTVRFSDEKGSHEIEADIVLNATGRVPCLSGVGLDAAGVEYTDTGITVDSAGKTNVPGIRACGDVTGRCLLAHAATREGIVAVNSMFGREDRMRYSAVPKVIYTHPEVVSVGATEEELSDSGIAFAKGVVPMALAGRFLTEYERESGTVKVLLGKEHGQVLGVHMIGGACGEFAATAAMMIEMELRPDEIREVVFPHPTVSEALKAAVLSVG